MNVQRELRTERLLLRRWVASDLDPFAELNSDPRVMEHFPSVLTRAESDAMVERIDAHFERHGFDLSRTDKRQKARTDKRQKARTNEARDRIYKKQDRTDQDPRSH